MCKLPSFSVDSSIAKIFYTFLFVICLVRTASFGAATGMYGGSLAKKAEWQP
jgi:hypothetical protein